jgi:hypothetical protein
MVVERALPKTKVVVYRPLRAPFLSDPGSTVVMSGVLFSDSGYDAALEQLAELQRARARAFAVEARSLAALAVGTSRQGWQAEAPRDSLVLDVAGTCEIGQLTASSRLDEAEHLVVRLPGTLGLLEAGELLVPQAMVLIAETRTCTPTVCAQVETRVLPTATGRARPGCGSGSARRCCGPTATRRSAARRPPAPTGGCGCARRPMGWRCWARWRRPGRPPG